MRRIHLGVLTLALPLLAASILVVGCSGTKDNTKSDGGGGEGTSPKPSELKAVDAKGGTIKGKITLKGSPDVKKLNEQLNEEMNKNQNKNECKHADAAPFEKEENVYRIGENSQVGNVFVWLAPAEGEYFRLSDKQVEQLKSNPVEIDQPHCAFIPHCSIFVPTYRDPKKPSKQIPTGQKVIIKNSAKFPHNTALGDLFNQTIKPETGQEELPIKTLKRDEPYMISCKIHGWMRGYIRTFDHPYATLSLAEPKAKPGDASFGTYEIKNTPVGKMRIIAWHEKAGYLQKGQSLSGEEITIKQDQPLEMNFELEPK